MKENNSDINIFIAYAREDKEYLHEMKITMNPLKNKGVNVWYDGLISSGMEWDETIKNNLHSSDIIIFLLSRYSLGSDYITQTEIPEAMERHKRGETIVIPIILERCWWQESQLSTLQVLPPEGVPVRLWKNGIQDAFYEIGVGLRGSIELVRTRQEEAKKIKEEQEKKIAEKKRQQENTVTISKEEYNKLIKDAKLKSAAKSFNNESLGVEKINEVAKILGSSNNIFRKTVLRAIPYFIAYIMLVFVSLTISLDYAIVTEELFIDINFWLAVLLSAVIIVGIFTGIYRLFRSLRTRLVLASSLSAGLGFGILLVIFLKWSGFNLPQPNPPAFLTILFSSLFASLISWLFASKYYLSGLLPSGEVFDIFISYSFKDSKWVKHNLYIPLSKLKKDDGSSYNIFFAEKDIGIGEVFTVKYMRAIVDSKLFIPVVSESYFKANHCINEMDLAVKRYVEKLSDVMIVTHDYEHIPEHFRNINFIDVSIEDNFIEKIHSSLNN